MVDIYSQRLQEHLDSKSQNEGYKHKTEGSKTKKKRLEAYALIFFFVHISVLQ
jgi:hypothetical protein